ncbi:uncharacterized protein VICG_02138 [Vittaforma corneae ATCC 50505]|uniref:Thioredoxin domain-containing protein n=1 Tax=Vittaforma corneae (strain ATCC 50505) TaxID=993615 RepID=L2GJY0_VITCO|nr:uncharacterized protein VICG_02138 [Vittaforma corneae ATCC 50505]ELA40825.1 hypothetical protein VICG_02138 [Vittaforma corneae ATCC 50505]
MSEKQGCAGKVIQIWPDDLLDVTGAEYSRFLIKFSAVNCSPCENLQAFLDSGLLELEHDLPVFQIKAKDNTTNVYNDLRKFFKFKTLPYCVVTSTSLDVIDHMAGFSDPEIFKSFIYKNFNVSQ